MTNYFSMQQAQHYRTCLASGQHWSLLVRRGMQLTLTDLTGGMNVGMLFFNPVQRMEKYNAPDTLKCQHTFKLTKNHCLYSDMGRIFAAITEDTFGWHETVCGNSNAEQVAQQWGARDYQGKRNKWHQNGYDAFLVELGKYNLKRQDMAANINFFSAVQVNEDSELSLQRQSVAGDTVTLRFEMDSLVLLHTCPHPMNQACEYPRGEVRFDLARAAEIKTDDPALNLCAENQRGYQNNALYHLGL